jgi:hypothetical protein
MITVRAVANELILILYYTKKHGPELSRLLLLYLFHFYISYTHIKNHGHGINYTYVRYVHKLK